MLCRQARAAFRDSQESSPCRLRPPSSVHGGNHRLSAGSTVGSLSSPKSLQRARVGHTHSVVAFSRPLPLPASASLRQIVPSRHGRTFRQSRGATVVSGLRTVRERWTFQACVLLTTQGCHDNSRIHWSTSQECQHVLSADIRSYFKSFNPGMRLLQGDRRPFTVKSYDQKWLRFESFTAQVQDDAGAWKSR